MPLERALPCIVADRGDMIVVDTSHPAYPRNKAGVGTILSSLLGKLWIKELPGCKCGHRRDQMDSLGADWVEANINEVSGWLQDEAIQRGIPYWSYFGKALIRKAIRLSREASQTVGGGP